MVYIYIYRSASKELRCHNFEVDVYTIRLRGGFWIASSGSMRLFRAEDTGFRGCLVVVDLFSKLVPGISARKYLSHTADERNPA